MGSSVDVAARSRTDPPASRATSPTAAATPSPAGPQSSWRLRTRELSLERPRVMGILNLTPDSFSDGGDLASVDDALERARAMVAGGADILDVGGESTRPGADPVPADREIERVLPLLERATELLSVPLSIDTRKAKVARRALDAGAEIVNDVSGLAHDPDMASVVAASGAGVVLMHMRGQPADMLTRAEYDDVVADVLRELGEAVGRARAAGVADEAVVLDPGIGFAKDTGHNLTLLRETGALLQSGFPLLVGPSRKRFLGEILGVPPKERVPGTVAACVAAYLAGARVFRVHDVEPVVQALRVAHAIRTGNPGGQGAP